MSQEKELTGYPSIDKPWLKYYTDKSIDDHLQGNTVYTNIYNNNSGHLGDIALEYYGRKISYGRLFEHVEQTKNALVAFGIKENEKVILFPSSTPETVYVVLALCRIGAVANMINPLFTKDEVIDRINETGAKLMIALDQLYDKISDAIPKTSIQSTVIVPIVQSMPPITRTLAKLKLKKHIPGKENVIMWNDFLKAGGPLSVDALYEKDRPLVMVYSSGSTGASKGIVLTNDGINATLLNYFRPDYFPHTRGEKMLQMIPVWFSTGIILSILMPLCVGVTTILEPVFSKETFARNLKRYKPNLALTATSLWLYVARCSSLKKTDLSNLHYPITGGEKVLPYDEELINHTLSSCGCKSKLLKGYGMCELGGTVTTDSEDHIKPSACGFPIMGVIVAAFDPDTNKEQKYGERGELRVCSPARMKEYFKNPEATKAFFQKDEEGSLWGCTGDIGYVDEDGFVYILGRAKDYFKRENGEIVFLFDIEAEILKNEAISQCKVVDIEDNGSQKLVAHLVFREGVDNKENVIASIWNDLRTALPSYMVPEYYKIRSSMPVHTNGKRDVGALRRDKDGLMKA